MRSSPVERRRAALSRLRDLSQGRGLEVGPLDAALVTPAIGKVAYVDVMARDALIESYQGHPLDFEAMPELDYTLQDDAGVVRPLREAVAPGAPYDWVVASHVLEHVPDLLAWLQDLAEVIADDGSLLMVVPDRRFTFDIRRTAATVGDVLLAHERGDTRPSVRAVYDNFRTAVDVPVDAAWRGERPTGGARNHTFDEVVARVEAAAAGEYVDVHVWPTTPRELLDILEDLARLGLHPLALDSIAATPHEDFEFYLALRRVPRSLTGDALLARQLASYDAGRTALPSENLTVLEQHLRSETEGATAQAVALEAEASRLRAEVADLRREVSGLREQSRRVRRRSRRLRAAQEEAAAEATRLRRQRDRARARLHELEQSLPRKVARVIARPGRLVRRGTGGPTDRS